MERDNTNESKSNNRNRSIFKINKTDLLKIYELRDLQVLIFKICSSLFLIGIVAFIIHYNL